MCNDMTERLARLNAEVTRVTREVGTAPVPLAALPAHVHPDDEQTVRRMVNSAVGNGRPGSAVFRMRHLSSYTHYVRLVAEPVPDPSGRTAAVRGAFQDVPAQHWTGTALAATTESLADSRQESAERHLLALRLQQAVLPPDRTSRPLPVPHGILLGATEHPDYREHHLAMRPGDVLLLHTDGLIERRDRSVEEPLDHLTRTLAEPAADLDALLDRALTTSTADTDDDTCLIAVEVLAAEPGENV
ncbi:SpoIIE family protein phosphatase [Kitasatospora sp. NA04385]|uniref:SpoIIE family protein phosphatase n=1 Tax=Kitasatospora sp. NA04385 TaxID=2742135 RepID=UPI0015920E9C|nr:SpoIIE family protein phosphatase [Kitasatospora sp. NA04385]QKW18114.1 SpoIIE family protein phosphatase [Kitasatospora sp. NA04385]